MQPRLRLKELRDEADVGQKEVASAVGVSLTTYNYWENGARNPNAKHRIKLARFFKCGESALFAQESEKTPPPSAPGIVLGDIAQKQLTIQLPSGYETTIKLKGEAEIKFIPMEGIKRK